MGSIVAKQGDRVVGVDTHVILVPSGGGPVPTPTPMPFAGPLGEQLCTSIFVDDQAAAVEGSIARNAPPHVPAAGPFQAPPSNKATVDAASQLVFFDGKGAARAGDPAKTCNDPADAPNGVVVAQGTVFAG